jgi:catechol 2,3-dioxygenase-like lactoylglutathione lyase family enzyme
MSHSIDHVGYSVNYPDKSKDFFVKALAPLGISLLKEFEGVYGFGRGQKADFWVVGGGARIPPEAPKLLGMHICFTAASREEVDAFYAAAIDAGATDNGKPGLRPEYHANYYGAFVFDLDGHNIEAAFHG